MMRIQSSLLFSLRDMNHLIHILTFLRQLLITCIGFPMNSMVLTYDVQECIFLDLVSTQVVVKTINVC
uniref:Uncharacterized protein n=1 Tax=Arundo donax TaxID=35708 RepID=A0A0A9GYA7_ARUDO